MIVVGFEESRMLRIYKFKNQDKDISLLTQIDSIKWDYYGARWYGELKESCIIESTFMIDKMTTKNELNEVILRFCLKENEKDKIKVIEIKNDGRWEIKKEIEGKNIDANDRFDGALIHLEGFVENRIIFKRLMEFKWVFSILDVEPNDLNVGEYFRLVLPMKAIQN